MSVQAPDPFEERLRTRFAVKAAMATVGMRQVFVGKDGAVLRPGPDGSLRVTGSVKTEMRPALDWGSVFKFTRANL